MKRYTRYALLLAVLLLAAIGGVQGAGAELRVADVATLLAEGID